MGNFTVVYDACVLYPAHLRDLLLRLAEVGLVQARWTNTIQNEWVAALCGQRPDLSPERLARTVTLMNDALDDCLVDGYEGLIPGLDLPDPDDRHVLAAAIRAGASAIVTMNLKDFPSESLERFEIEAIHPDDFICDLGDLAPSRLIAVAKAQRADLHRPPLSAEEYVALFVRLGLPGIAAFLGDNMDLI